MALRKDERLERPNGPEGNEDGEVARFQDDALVSREFQREIGAEQAGTGMRSRILALMEEFFRGLIRERFGGPDLAVRMRIARAHERSAVFENLHAGCRGRGAEFGRFLGLGADHGANFFDREIGQGEMVLRTKAENAATASFRSGDQQAAFVQLTGSGIRSERGIVVVEDENAVVARVDIAASASVAWAHIALRVVFGNVARSDGFNLALPGTLRAMGRDHDPFAGKRVAPPVGAGEEIGHAMHSLAPEVAERT